MAYYKRFTKEDAKYFNLPDDDPALEIKFNSAKGHSKESSVNSPFFVETV